MLCPVFFPRVLSWVWILLSIPSLRTLAHLLMGSLCYPRTVDHKSQSRPTSVAHFCWQNHSWLIWMNCESLIEKTLYQHHTLLYYSYVSGTSVLRMIHQPDLARKLTNGQLRRRWPNETQEIQSVIDVYRVNLEGSSMSGE